MHIDGPATVDEMIGAFLRAELRSDRWGDDHVRNSLSAHGWPATLVSDPDISDPTANERRAQVLSDYRGWPDRLLFLRFPSDVVWHHATLQPGEVEDVLGANYRTWLLLSNGTRRVADCAHAARTGPLPKLPPGEDRTNVAEAAVRAHWVARRYAAGEDLGPPILVAPSSLSPVIGVEGHTRLIGWALARRDEPIPVIVGTSDHLADWAFF